MNNKLMFLLITAFFLAAFTFTGYKGILAAERDEMALEGSTSEESEEDPFNVEDESRIPSDESSPSSEESMGEDFPEESLQDIPQDESEEPEREETDD